MFWRLVIRQTFKIRTITNRMQVNGLNSERPENETLPESELKPGSKSWEFEHKFGSEIETFPWSQLTKIRTTKLGHFENIES